MAYVARSSWARAAGAVTAAVLLCACSAGSRPFPGANITPPALDGAHAPASLAAAESALPLASYAPSEQEHQTIIRAQGILQIRCMEQRGYRGFTPTPVVRSPATFPGGGGPFGYINPAYAAERGFQPPVYTSGSGRSAEIMPLAEAQAASDCAFRAQSALRPVSATGKELLNNLDLKSEQHAAADPRVLAATRAWAACMKAGGFDDASPASLALEPWPAVPSAKETATAKADAACTSSVNLAGIYFAALAGYQLELNAPHAKELATVQIDGQSEVTRAAHIVATG